MHTPYMPVAEINAAMIGSYLLVDPLGRIFTNTTGEHTYSDSLLDCDITHALSQVQLNRDAFLGRGGLYKW